MSEAATVGSRDEAFIGYLERLHEREDRAALAALRRGLGKEPGEDMEALKHVLRFNPPERDEHWYCLVGALYALHPATWMTESGERPFAANFGASLSRLWFARETGRESLEQRFVALLSADQSELPDKLRHAVNQLRSETIPVNWLQLLRDLRFWDADGRRVQRRWARAFWSASAGQDTAGTPQDVPASESETSTPKEDE